MIGQDKSLQTDTAAEGKSPDFLQIRGKNCFLQTDTVLKGIIPYTLDCIGDFYPFQI